ncbi:hypothetical protein ES703_74351 [subsurface metagenome]
MEEELLKWTIVNATWAKWMAIGTLIMALAILITVIFAWITLYNNKKTQMEELSTKMVDIWYKEKNDESLKKIAAFYRKKSKDLEGFIKKEKTKPIDFTVTDEEFTENIHELIKIKNFIYKLNYYIEKKKLSPENISIDFYEILNLRSVHHFIATYNIIRWGYENINFGVLMPFNTEEDRKILNNFFLNIAKYNNYKQLINIILEDNKNN